MGYRGLQGVTSITDGYRGLQGVTGGYKGLRRVTVSLLNLKTISKFRFLRMLELRGQIFCFWIRRGRIVRPGNGFRVNFSSFLVGSDRKMSRPASK